MKDNFYKKLSLNPIIAAVNDINRLEEALESPCEVLFLLSGSIFNLKEIVKKVHNSNKNIYVHIELLEGSSKDITALKFIGNVVKPDGIITTKANLIKNARELDLFSIQRLFMIDSLSLETGIKSIRATNPNAVEIMPGIIPQVTEKMIKMTRKAVITGGFINNKSDIIRSLEVGAEGVSTSKKELWYT